MNKGTDPEAQWWATAEPESVRRARRTFARLPQSTLSGSESRQRIGDKFSAKASNKHLKTCKPSGRAAICRLRGGSIRKKIIGHRLRSIMPGFPGGKCFRQPRGTFPLVQKPARQHSGGVLFHPLVQQCTDLLAEIGGVGKTGQFKTLQRVPRSGKKELPGRLT